MLRPILAYRYTRVTRGNRKNRREESWYRGKS